MVTENRAEAVSTPPEASPPFTKFSAVLSSPVLPELCPTRSLFDQVGGELVSTVLATASFCCSLANAGATATTSPENEETMSIDPSEWRSEATDDLLDTVLALPDREELKRVGFKVLPQKLSGHQLLSISHFWILGMVTATLLLLPMQLVQLPILQGLIAGLAISFAIWTTSVQKKTLFMEKTAAKLRIGLHIYLGLILGCVLLNGLLLRLAL